MVILEESHTGAPAMMKVVASSYFGGFTPIRAKKFGTTNAGADTGSDDTGSAGDDTSSGASSGGGSSSSGGGESCSADGDCNPGNDGSGLICKSGQCVPGCHTNAQCPGVKTCHSGQCS
jgi:hypothetical protein